MEENYLSQANLEAIKETLQLEILKRGINAPIGYVYGVVAYK